VQEKSYKKIIEKRKRKRVCVASLCFEGSYSARKG
jgi:hypothetical protein